MHLGSSGSRLNSSPFSSDSLPFNIRREMAITPPHMRGTWGVDKRLGTFRNWPIALAEAKPIFSSKKNRNFPKVSELIRRHPDASECIRMDPNRSEQVRASPKTSKNSRKPRKFREKFAKKFANACFSSIFFLRCLGRTDLRIDASRAKQCEGLDFEVHSPVDG